MTETPQSVISTMNQLGAAHEPFLFFVDFALQSPQIYPLQHLPSGIYFHTPLGSSPHPPGHPWTSPFFFHKYPVPFEQYQRAFEQVQYHLHRGDTFLLNLTMPTPIATDLSLAEIYIRSHAPYKLYVENQFACFSPERFVRIEHGAIYSDPMKGTIDADVPNAEQKILSDRKERAEHNTIVDLIRNDLGMVSQNVRVERYRYITRIRTHERTLLQVSSCIVGTLGHSYLEHLGDILWPLLPAGSISGAPKPKTLEIIQAVEPYTRGYYTGIFGIFDGNCLDTAVMIRFIESQNNQLIFKSGGGITALSDIHSEYQEMVEKVYVPFV